MYAINYYQLLCVGAEFWDDRVVIHTYMCMLLTMYFQLLCVGAEFWDDRVVIHTYMCMLLTIINPYV